MMNISFNDDDLNSHHIKNAEEFDALMQSQQSIHGNKNLHRIGSHWWTAPDATDYPCLVILNDPIYNGDHEYFDMTILPNCEIIEDEE